MWACCRPQAHLRMALPATSGKAVLQIVARGAIAGGRVAANVMQGPTATSQLQPPSHIHLLRRCPPKRAFVTAVSPLHKALALLSANAVVRFTTCVAIAE